MKRTSRTLRNRNRSRAGNRGTQGPSPTQDAATRTEHELSTPSLQAALLPEPVPLGQASAQWLMGDWPRLLRLQAGDIAAHPERGRLALLVACAHLQCDQPAAARDLIRQAIAWGCPPKLVARLLVSGLHNTLGRVAALRDDSTAVEHHFGEALRVTGDPQAPTAAHARAVREMARLGLLPQAAGLIQQDMEALAAATTRPAQAEAQLTSLRSEVELLQHELTIALQRNVDLLRGSGPLAARPPEEGDLARFATSQLGQDLWVLDRQADRQRPGFFVEFGATDGVRLSNTYLLEKAYGWRGICLEPNPKFFEQLQRNRTCTVGPDCIGGQTGQVVEFLLAEEYGCMAQHAQEDNHAAKRAAYGADPRNRIQLQTVSLHDALTRYGAPRRIDYLSVDTEGSEYEILSAFPFDRWDVRLITVEHNHGASRERLRGLLEAQGYRRTEMQWDDFYEKT